MKTQRGFSLVELMIVITLVVIGVALAAGLGLRADRQQSATRFTNELSLIESRIRDGWSAENNYATVSTTAVIARGFVPPAMIVDANTLRNAWGGTWAITPSTWAGGVAEAVNGVAYQITADNVPTDMCVEALMRAPRAYLGVTVNNGTLSWPVTNVGQQPTLAAATTACTSATNVVVVSWITS